MIFKNRFSFALLFALALTACKKEYADPAIDPSLNQVEATYTAAGSEAVSTTIVRDGSGNNQYIIYYPTRLTGPYPVITWGNGSAQNPGVYANTLQHLASWGYIVIDNYDESTGPGATILASAQYIVAQNSIASSPFYGKVDVSRVAAAGHSQGGAGVVNASKQSGNLIKTIVPISIAPNIGGNFAYRAEDIRVPVFFIGGAEDNLLSPPNVSKVAFDLVSTGVPAVKGIRLAADHDALRDNDREWGYLTAWLQFQLKGDQTAAKAFTGTSAEIFTNTRWTDVVKKSL